jgi:hypothetical protein
MAYQGRRKRNYPKGKTPAAAGSNSKIFGNYDRIDLVRKGRGLNLKSEVKRLKEIRNVCLSMTETAVSFLFHIS